MGAAMIRCFAALARKAKMQARPDVRDRCARGTERRSHPSPRVWDALPVQPLEPAVTARIFATKMVSGHPGDRPTGQGFSLFINTLKINRSGIILAFN